MIRIAFLFLLIFINIQAEEIKIVGKVDNQVITNVDVKQFMKKYHKENLSIPQAFQLLLLHEIKKKTFAMQQINYLDTCKEISSDMDEISCVDSLWLSMLEAENKQNQDKEQRMRFLIMKNQQLLEKMQSIFLVEMFQNNLR